MAPQRTFSSPPRLAATDGRRPAPSEARLISVSLAQPLRPHWLREISSTPELTVRLLACRPIPPDGARSVQWVEIAGPPAAIDRALGQLPEGTEVASATRRSTGAIRRVVVWVEAEADEGCRLVYRSGSLCRTCQFVAPVRPDRTVVWELVGPGRRPIRPRDDAWTELIGGPRSLRRLRTYRPDRGPTEREREALAVAHRLGYFTVPRRAGLAEVATALHVRRSAAGELLRRALFRLLETSSETGTVASPTLRRAARSEAARDVSRAARTRLLGDDP